jgi:hypothetical protein
MSVAVKQRREALALHGMAPPHPKQLAVLNYLLAPNPNHLKKADLICGRGFGKSLLCIIIAVYCLSIDGNQCGLFLEPDTKRVEKVFLAKWRKHVPRYLYEINYSKQRITWCNGSVLYWDHRDIYGSLEARRDRDRGPDYTWIISDEEAIKCDIQQYSNTLAACREKGPVRFYLTATTPKIGEYRTLTSMEDHRVFVGTSHDNPHLPSDFIPTLMASMSRDQIRREIYAEFVALEGRIWKEWDSEHAWPKGNIHHGLAQFDPSKPWWLFCDLGSATAAYVVVQNFPAERFGQRMFDGNVWVAVADLCPYHDANAVRAFNRLKAEYGSPVAVTGGNDINTRSGVDGKTISYHAQKVWPNCRVIPVDESYADKTIQFDRLSFMICSGDGNRRFCMAKNYREIEPEGRRGLKQMFEEDVWPDVPTSATEFLPKKADIMIQHVRDALLMGTAAIMSPPKWGYQDERTK